MLKKMAVIEGKFFNWEKKPVYADIDNDMWVHSINFFDDGEVWGCTWDNNNYIDSTEPEPKIFTGFEREGFLYIGSYSSSSTSIKIACNLDLAEIIVMNFAKANKYKIQPLYKKRILLSDLGKKIS